MQESLFSQTTLPIGLARHHAFANFLVGQNEECVTTLKKGVDAPLSQAIYLWGAEGVGKTHLLQASCNAVREHNKQAWYFSCREINNTAGTSLNPSILENMAKMSVVAIDDIDALVGNDIWQEALFHAYNQIVGSTVQLIVAANVPPTQLNFALKDLLSRLQHGLQFKIQECVEEDKLILLQQCASEYGLQLSDEVASFILTRTKRDVSHLINVIEVLDRASLSLQRRLTIPLVKEVLGL